MKGNQNMNEYMRKEEYDIAKALGIFLVILGHMPSIVPENIRTWIYSFHMPLFYVISGYFSKDINSRENFFKYIKRKWRGLMNPYIVICATFFAIDLVCGRISWNQIGRELQSICCGMQGVQWFLYNLFIVSLLFSISRMIKSIKIQYGFIILCVLLSCIIGEKSNQFQIASALYGIGFYYLGFIKGKSIEYNLKKAMFSIVASIIGVGILSHWNISRILDMKSNYHVDILINYCLAFCGIYAIISLSIVLKKTMLAKFLIYVGRNSLCFFTLTWYVPNLLGEVLKKQNFICKIGYYIFALVFASVIAEIVKKIRSVNLLKFRMYS